MKYIDYLPYVVVEGTPILDALCKVNTPPLYLALVIDQENKLKGILTDGDLRRGLLDGKDLGKPVDAFMKLDPCVAFDSITQLDAEKLLRLKKLYCLPILSKDGRLVKLLTSGYDTQEARTDKTAVIMAGGKGSRLYPLTENCPKPMLKINGKPILEILIQQCIEAGFSRFYLSVNYLKEQIIDYFDEGKSMGVSIDYLIEEQPLGTAGSLKLLPDTVIDPFLVLNGDLLTKFDHGHLMQFHNDHRPSATMCVRENVTHIPFGVVQTDGFTLVGFEEKPTYRLFVNAGIYVIDPIILKYLEPNTAVDMPTLLINSQKSGERVIVCPIHEYWLDIGRPETLKSAQLDWKTE